MKIFDTHAHYDDEHFDEDREEIIKKIHDSGVEYCIDIGCDIETSKKAIEIAKAHDFIYATCGIHPSEIEDQEEKIMRQIQEIKKLVLSCDKVVGIGEIGLDYHYKDGPSKELQKFAFIEQIKLANELKLPISVHTRDAIDDTIEIIRKYKFEYGGILHCCPFNRELVKHGLEQGLHIAFGGTATFKNARNAEEIVKLVPDNKLLIETDSPYLAPDPLRGTRNNSSNLKYIIKKIAEFRNTTDENIANITFNNAKKIFF